MRREGERRRLRSALARQAYYNSHQLVMRGVHAVEVADSDGGGREGTVRLRNALEYLHAVDQRSTATSRPSYASRTPAGNRLPALSCARSCEMCVNQVSRGFSRSTVFRLC